ncbi:MAG: A/G-specific adenine glycosylase [Schleiferiaceae bacterium]
MSYYHSFMDQFPTVKDLACASEDAVLKTWEGLGYYSRARNLHKAAKWVYYENGGEFPNNYAGLLKLPGIGPYTASAIASICYNEPVAAVDGNVIRVLSRIFDLDFSAYDAKGKRAFDSYASRMLAHHPPGNHNQAMMEFGAVICTPFPKCDQCPIVDSCESYRLNNQSERPIKKKKVVISQKQMHYALRTKGDKIAIEQRPTNGIWGGLFQLPLMEEAPKYQSAKKLAGPITHKLSHVHMEVFLWDEREEITQEKERQWATVEELKKLGFPIVLKRLIDDKVLPLMLD